MSTKKLPKTLTKEEVLKLLSQPNKKAPTGLRNRCIMQLMYRAGLRESEVINLGPRDIEWKEGILRVWKGKGAKDRTLYLDEHTLDLLRAWSDKKPGSRCFFCTLKGKKLNDRYIREMIERYGEKAGIGKHVNPHMLRHTFATELLQEGYNIREVQKLLGHTDVSTTMIYTHVYDSDLANKMRLRKPLDV
ncbi:MAG: tyrosine-type recombinase/integrase [Ignavibacteriales bacterium]